MNSNSKLLDSGEESISFTTPKISLKNNLCIVTPKLKKKHYKDQNLDDYFFNDP